MKILGRLVEANLVRYVAKPDTEGYDAVTSVIDFVFGYIDADQEVLFAFRASDGEYYIDAVTLKDDVVLTAPMYFGINHQSDAEHSHNKFIPLTYATNAPSNTVEDRSKLLDLVDLFDKVFDGFTKAAEQRALDEKAARAKLEEVPTSTKETSDASESVSDTSTEN